MASGDEDIRRYLAGKTAPSRPAATPPLRVRRRPPATRAAAPETFKDFSATHMACPRCRRAVPVRERLLLVLPDGDLYDYICSACGSSCGTRKAGR